MNPSAPQITAIICTYRRPEMLQRSIASVLQQTFTDFQICVYDNASGDETGAVVAALAQQDSRIKYICRPKNIGLLANYSEAMKDVQTPFFSFIADDDIMLPGFYEAAMVEFQQHPSAMFFAGSYLCLSLEGNKMGGVNFERELLPPPSGVFKFVESQINPNLHGTLLRREVVDNCAEFSKFDPWADRDLLYRIAARYPAITSPVECLLFTMHNLDKGGRVTIDFAWQENETILRNLQPLLSPEANTKLQKIFQQRIPEAIYFLAIELLYAGDFAGARQGAQKLQRDYHKFWPPLVLHFLAFILEKIPALHKFLQSTRDLRPHLKQQQQPLILSYDALMNIYLNKKY